jgi:peptidoglycan/LPS O-acetylase OafA/YrhL
LSVWFKAKSSGRSLLPSMPESNAASATVPPSVPERKPPLPGLTGVRTFLAIGIMFFHFTPPLPTYIRPMIEAGFTYISFFLLISGFVLAYNYAHRADTLQPGRFYLARLSRLYPVYVLSLIVSLGMLHSEWQMRPFAEFLRGFLLTPFLLQGWSPTLATFWNTVAWTLATEAMLYLAFPHIIRMRWWPKEPKKLLLLFLGFWAWEMVLPTVYLVLNPDGLHDINRYSSGYWLRALKYTPLPFLPIFLAGITLGRLHGSVPLSDRVKMWLALVAGIGIISSFYLLVPRVPYVMLHGGMLTPVFALLVLGLTGTHWISKVLGWGPIGAFGRASLCLYLLHFNTWIYIHDKHLPERLHVAQFDPWISYAFILLWAYAAFLFVEKPAQKFLLSRFVHRPVQVPAEVAAPLG